MEGRRMRTHNRGKTQGMARQSHPTNEDEIPTIHLPVEVCPDIAEWHLALITAKAATDRRREVEARLASSVEPLWRERCSQDKRVYQQVILNGGDAGTINMVHSPS